MNSTLSTPAAAALRRATASWRQAGGATPCCGSSPTKPASECVETLPGQVQPSCRHEEPERDPVRTGKRLVEHRDGLPEKHVVRAIRRSETLSVGEPEPVDHRLDQAFRVPAPICSIRQVPRAKNHQSIRQIGIVLQVGGTVGLAVLNEARQSVVLTFRREDGVRTPTRRIVGARLRQCTDHQPVPADDGLFVPVWARTLVAC